MQGFNYIQKDFIPRVDLATLGQTFNTLEQGHQAAVKASSDLEAAIAKLEMNEAEDGFKEQLVSEIRQTIDDNTLFGNSYAALDNLVAKSGDIMTDGRIIGRVRNQLAKKEYDARVDAMKIPDGMKEMYKEENPYYYKEGEVDKRTGRIKPGEKWQATTKPVTTIPQAEIAKYALSIAAKDAGGGDSITFLDANDRPTSDPNKSATGEMYKQVGTKFEALSKDKIRKAYREAIQAIPGAEDSLRQDYRYMQYEHKKLVKDGSPNPYVQGLTDKNGNIYSFDRWLNNRIEGLADVAAYNHSYSTTSFGTALQSHKAGLANNANNPTNTGFGSFIFGTKTEEGNSFAELENTKLAANNQGLSILNKVSKNAFKGETSISSLLKNLMNSKKATGPGSAVNYLIKTYGKNMSYDDKVRLNNSIIGYYQAEKQLQPILKAAGGDVDAIKFSAEVNKGEFTNSNKYSRTIIKELNNFYANNPTYKAAVGANVMSNILKQYKFTDISQLRSLGINVNTDVDGNYQVEINEGNRMQLPRFTEELHKAESMTSSNLGGWAKKKFTSGVGKGNFYEYGIAKSTGDFGITTGNPTIRLRNAYVNAKAKAAKIESKVGVTKGMRTIMANDAGSYTELYYRANPGGRTDEQLNTVIKAANERVDRMFANGNFDSGIIEEVDAAGNTISNIEDAQDIKTLIQSMYADASTAKDIARVVLVPRGASTGQPKGYGVAFTVPKGKAVGKFKEGQFVKFTVHGIMNEEKNFDPSFNPTNLANNAIQISRTTNSPVRNFGYNTHLGNTSLTPIGNGKYQSSFMGKSKVMSENEAEDFTANMYALEQIKPRYVDAYINYATSQNEATYNQLKLVMNSVEVIKDNISRLTDKDPTSVEYGIMNYINYDN